MKRETKPEAAVKRRTQSLVEHVRHELERRIVTGVLTPGTRLEESAIARELGVSRTPVREAVRQLVAARLLEHALNRSAVVADPSRDELAALFETTAELEALCAGFAAARMRQLDRVRLVELQEDCEAANAADDPDAFAAANERFHEHIWRCARNPTLEELMQTVRIRGAAYRTAQFSDPQRMKASLAEHRQIVAAVLSGSSERAAKVMRQHLSNASTKVLRLVFSG